MINSENIKEYINFLHMKKYSAPATEELKSRWSVLRDDEIVSQLQGLYLHWGIDNRTAGEYENMFLQFQQSIASTPYGDPLQQSSFPQQGPAKNNKTVVYISLIIALLGVCGFMFYKMSQHPAPHPGATDTSSVALLNNQTDPEVPQSAKAPVDTTTKVSDGPSTIQSDPQKIKVIENLLKAEESRDMSGILSCFSPNLQQYWDVKVPTQSDLVNRYNNTWTKTSDNANHDVRIERISDNVYDMFSVYEYYSNKDGQAKSVNTHVRFVFDDDNKIVKTFGVK